jgi:hypothetical protein
VTAPILQDAAARLAWASDDQRRHQRALDQARAALHLTNLRDERGRLVARIPPDVSTQLADARAELTLSEVDISGSPGGPGTLVDRIVELEAAATGRREFLAATPRSLIASARSTGPPGHRARCSVA